ncbi:MAG: N-acetyltransferase [Lachnospiraceae bacterium]|nr:N-acetyltransferase [Lachnospiraceae bacterium]
MGIMNRMIKSMEDKYLQPSLELVETVFAQWDSPEEGKVVRSLVEEIRSKKYYIPKLEFIMVDKTDEVIGYAMFSRFHLEGKYEEELLILTPVAVKTELQRQHISKDILEHGFEAAKELGFKAILVEGDPRNYNSRGFQPSYKFGVEAGPNVHLPHPDCLMIKELEEGALAYISGLVDYSFYDALHEG